MNTSFRLQASNGLWVAMKQDGTFFLSPNKTSAVTFSDNRNRARYPRFCEQCAEMNINPGDFIHV